MTTPLELVVDKANLPVPLALLLNSEIIPEPTLTVPSAD